MRFLKNSVEQEVNLQLALLNDTKKLKLGPLSLSVNETLVNLQQHFPFFFFLPPISSAFTSFLANLNVSLILDG